MRMDETGVLVIGATIPIITGLILMIMGSASFSRLSHEFKTKYFPQMINRVLPDVDYHFDRGLSQPTVYATEFIKNADRFHSEDLFIGQIDGVDFIGGDVHLEERHVEQTKEGTREYYVTYFLGRIFEFTFNKSFEGSLQVLESGSIESNRKYHKIKLESVDFNKKFRTYATTELTAFYILTPEIMESILNLEKNNPGKVNLSFYGDKMYIAINNSRDTFELKLFRKIDQRVIDEYQKDLGVFKDIVSALRLNVQIFKQ
jgi:hypothetical protein